MNNSNMKKIRIDKPQNDHSPHEEDEKITKRRHKNDSTLHLQEDEDDPQIISRLEQKKDILDQYNFILVFKGGYVFERFIQSIASISELVNIKLCNDENLKGIRVYFLNDSKSMYIKAQIECDDIFINKNMVETSITVNIKRIYDLCSDNKGDIEISQETGSDLIRFEIFDPQDITSIILKIKNFDKIDNQNLMHFPKYDFRIPIPSSAFKRSFKPIKDDDADFLFWLKRGKDIHGEFINTYYVNFGSQTQHEESCEICGRYQFEQKNADGPIIIDTTGNDKYGDKSADVEDVFLKKMSFKDIKQVHKSFSLGEPMEFRFSKEDHTPIAVVRHLSEDNRVKNYCIFLINVKGN